MTNFEKYKDMLLALNKGDDIAVVKGKPVSCSDIACTNCDYSGGNCESKLLKWLLSEYKEEPTLTERQYHFLKALPLNSRLKLELPQLNGIHRLNIQTIDGKVWIIPGELFSRVFPSLPIKFDNKWHVVSELLTWKVEGEE